MANIQLKCDVCLTIDHKVVSKCENCNEIMCFYCEKAHRGMRISKGHKLIPIDTVLKAYQTELKKEQHALSECNAEVNSKIEDIEDLCQDVKGNAKENIQKLQDLKQEMIQKIQQHHNGMEATIREITDELVQNLNDCKRQCTSVKEQLQNMQNVIDCTDNKLLAKSVEGLKTDIENQFKEIKTNVSAVKPHVKAMVAIGKKCEFIPKNFTELHVCVNRKTVDYSLLHTKNFQKVASIDLEVANFRKYKIKFISNKIWCIVGDDISIYNEDYTFFKHGSINDFHGILCGFAQTLRSDFVVACDTQEGLHHIDSSGNYVGCIIKGRFIDVCTEGNTVYALQVVAADCQCYSVDFSRNCNCQSCIIVYKQTGTTLSFQRKIKLSNSNYREGTNMYISGNFICVKSVDSYSFDVYSLGGELLRSEGNEVQDEHSEFSMINDSAGHFFQTPVLCDVDSLGHVMVCEPNERRFHTFNQETKKWNVFAVQNRLFHWDRPYFASLDNEGKYLWVITYDQNLSKFSMKEKLVHYPTSVDHYLNGKYFPIIFVSLILVGVILAFSSRQIQNIEALPYRCTDNDLKLLLFKFLFGTSAAYLFLAGTITVFFSFRNLIMK